MIDAKKHLLSNPDTLLLSVPTLTLVSIGVGFNFLEQSDRLALKNIGWLGCRTFTLLGMLSGIPLIVMNFAKAILAKTVNMATCNHFEVLRDYDSYTNTVLTLSLTAVLGLSVLVPHVANLISMGWKASEIFVSVQDTVQKIQANAVVIPSVN